MLYKTHMYRGKLLTVAKAAEILAKTHPEMGDGYEVLGDLVSDHCLRIWQFGPWFKKAGRMERGFGRHSNPERYSKPPKDPDNADAENFRNGPIVEWIRANAETFRVQRSHFTAVSKLYDPADRYAARRGKDAELEKLLEKLDF